MVGCEQCGCYDHFRIDIDRCLVPSPDGFWQPSYNPDGTEKRIIKMTCGKCGLETEVENLELREE